MSITADNKGTLSGKFTIPADIPAGTKLVRFEGQGGSRAEAHFVGLGTEITNVMQQVTTRTTSYYQYDPLAQTFRVDENMQLAGVDVWFTAKGGAVTLQLRETANGYPSRLVLAQARIEPEHIVVSGGGHTRLLFEAPAFVVAGTEYALVLLCDDAQTSLAIAELGKFDALAQRYVTSQPYQVGVLLSSSNASTWTAHQDRDLAFRLLRANFSATSELVALGSVQVQGITDFMLTGLALEPGAATRVEYRVTLPDATHTELSLADGQPVRLAAPLTGSVSIAARLTGSAQLSPVLWAGAQFIAGTAAQSADYVSRAVPAVGGTKTRVIVDAVIPSGAQLGVQLAQNAGSFAAMIAGSSTALGEGWREYNFESSISNADTVTVKLVLSGTSQARPRVKNLRVMVV